MVEKKVNAFPPQLTWRLFDIFLSILAVPDVIIDDMPHHFKTFMSNVRSKTSVSAIICIVLDEYDIYINEEVIIKILECVITNIRVRMKNDFFFGKNTTNSVNEELVSYMNCSLTCLRSLFGFEIRNRGYKERNNFVSKYIDMGGSKLLSELSSYMNNSSLFSFAMPPSASSSVSSSLRLPLQMLPDDEVISGVFNVINNLLVAMKKT
jgi:hypothetical protein